MCNLYSITTSQDAIRRLFGVATDGAGNLPSMPGVFPDYPAPIVRNAGGEREMVMMRWGMPPPPRTGGPPVTNIRNTTSPHWRGWLKSESRCLVPANSFAEYAPEPNPVTAGHRASALALPVRSDMRLSFTFLLSGSTLGLLFFGSAEIAAIAGSALVPGCAALLERDGNGLASALHLAAFAVAAALEFAVLELMHDPPRNSLLTWSFACHWISPVFQPSTKTASRRTGSRPWERRCRTEVG
jgi:SOS response associated peptidase (SRAP)